MSIINNQIMLKALRHIPSTLACLILVSGCGNSKLIKCEANFKKASLKWLAMPSGECKKIAGTKILPLNSSQTKKAKTYPYDTYVKCYGIAAAGMNDCGTKTSACGGSVNIANSPEAWIALPKGICQKLKGSRVVEQPKKK
jgi:uncharacterized membrane protein